MTLILAGTKENEVTKKLSSGTVVLVKLRKFKIPLVELKVIVSLSQKEAKASL